MPRVVKSTWKYFYLEFIPFHVYIHMDLCTISCAERNYLCLQRTIEDVAMSQEELLMMAYMCCHLAVASKKIQHVRKIEHSDWSKII
jgi:hypothetical protein